MKTCALALLASVATCGGFGVGPPSVRRVPSPQLYSASDVDGSIDERDDASTRHSETVSRRSLFHSAGLSFAGAVSSGPASMLLRSLGVDASASESRLGGAAHAMGLVHFPCHPGDLMNTYHLMRAGESGLEAEGVLSTNPLFMTNREDALTPLGIEQVEDACAAMMSRGINPSVVKYSLASKCIDAANIVATNMLVGRNRIVPEFTFMDPRGAGIWDGRSLASTEAAIWAMDAAEAGDEGRNGRPPANDDGTANETLSDQVTRLRQLMSILETQYSGDDILLIFPDGTSPALLSCLIAGIPLKNVHALNYLPGELREGVDMSNSRRLLKEKISSPVYNEMISVGREELQRLRKEETMRQLENAKPRELLVNKSQQGLAPTKKHAQQKAPRVADKSAMEKVDLLPGPDFFSVGAAASIGYMAMWRGPKEESDESESTPEAEAAPVLAYANSTGASLFEQGATMPFLLPETVPSVALAAAPGTWPVTTEKDVGTVAAASTVEFAATNVVDSSDGVNPNLFEDKPVPSPKARVEAAEQAMKEYLSQDDGGEDWLASMKDILDED